MEKSLLLGCPVCGTKLDIGNIKTRLDIVCDNFWGKKFCFCSKNCKNHFFNDPKIAYFSMEIGIKNEIPTYSGGLGVLAGDIVKASADLKLQMVALTLASRKGYFKQIITNEGEQQEYPQEWDPSKSLFKIPKTTTITLEDRPVKIQAWLYEHRSPNGGLIPIFFLDTDVEGNSPEDRRITDYLYGGDKKYRLKQEIVLGIGGTRILEAISIKINKYHMNEGQSALLTLELLKKFNLNSEKVQNHCVFTTHTPIEAAFDQFSYELFQKLLGNQYMLSTVKQYAGQENLNMTYLALNLSKYVNGVSKAHMKYSKKMFPGHYIRSVTNGVHSFTWTCKYFRQLFDKYIPSWANEPVLLVRASDIPNIEIWDAHTQAKQQLLNYIKQKSNVNLDPQVLTIGFARRATGYKRSTLIFSDLDRLKEINKKSKFQIIFAGKAHPRDIEGKELIKTIYRYAHELKDQIKIVYLENYDMNIASLLTSGVDVWLNTPIPPMEASGTSGMKAAHNGVLNFSILDGWWIEGCIEGVTGWGIGPHPSELVTIEERKKRELSDLYSKLEYLILPNYYQSRDSWINLMKNSISKIAYYFQTQGVVKRYITEAYLL